MLKSFLNYVRPAPKWFIELWYPESSLIDLRELNEEPKGSTMTIFALLHKFIDKYLSIAGFWNFYMSDFKIGFDNCEYGLCLILFFGVQMKAWKPSKRYLLESFTFELSAIVLVVRDHSFIKNANQIVIFFGVVEILRHRLVFFYYFGHFSESYINFCCSFSVEDWLSERFAMYDHLFGDLSVFPL